MTNQRVGIKWTALGSLLLVLVLLLAGCGGTQGDGDTAASANGKIRVVATIFPPYDFTREIAGDEIALTMLLKPGSESHSYEPTPQDIITIQNADVFIYVGGESDVWVDEILDSMDTEQMEIISLMDVVELYIEETVEGMDVGHEDEEEAEYDEHVWTSPQNARVIVQAISEVLCRADPEHAAAFQENTDAYIEALVQLDEAFRDVAANGVRTELIFADRYPFRYFSEEYGLTYYAAFPGCSTETEASAATVAFLIDKVREDNIPVVFYIEFSNEKMADTICESTGAEKLLLHSCHNVTKDDFEAGATYLSLMTQNIENLREALG